MKWILTIILFAASYFATGQNKRVLGYIKDSATRLPIGFASITAQQTGKTRIADLKGLFDVTIAQNDYLHFAAIGYKTLTVYYNDLGDMHDTIVVILAPITEELQPVSISTTGDTRYQRDSVARREQFMNDVHDTIMPVMDKSKYDVGFTLNLDHFTKRQKNLRKSFNIFDETEKEEYINYRFNPEFVHKYTGLTGDSLQLFLEKYRPAYDWLRAQPRGDALKYYINDDLKLFFNRQN